jgi:hypothetical protein
LISVVTIHYYSYSENGQRIFNKLKEEMPEKSFTILMVKLAVRKEIIKKQMEVTDGKVGISC